MRTRSFCSSVIKKSLTPETHLGYQTGSCIAVNYVFSETLRKLREDKGLTQKQLGKLMFVNHSTIARWENATRLPDAAMISRLAKCLGADVNALFQLVAQSEECPSIIIVDDNKVILSEGVAVLEEAVPNATITGFIWPLEAIEYAKMNRVALAFLDIELGSASGLDLCRTLLDINPRTNIVFVTAYADYFVVFMLCCLSGLLDSISQYYLVPRAAYHCVLLLECLLLSLPLPMLTVYLLHCCGEDLRSSKLLRAVAGMWAVYFVLLTSTLFIGGVHPYHAGQSVYPRASVPPRAAADGRDPAAQLSRHGATPGTANPKNLPRLPRRPAADDGRADHTAVRRRLPAVRHQHGPLHAVHVQLCAV